MDLFWNVSGNQTSWRRYSLDSNACEPSQLHFQQKTMSPSRPSSKRIGRSAKRNEDFKRSKLNTFFRLSDLNGWIVVVRDWKKLSRNVWSNCPWWYRGITYRGVAWWSIHEKFQVSTITSKFFAYFRCWHKLFLLDRFGKPWFSFLLTCSDIAGFDRIRPNKEHGLGRWLNSNLVLRLCMRLRRQM